MLGDPPVASGIFSTLRRFDQSHRINDDSKQIIANRSTVSKLGYGMRSSSQQSPRKNQEKRTAGFALKNEGF
jgi:hypothetical protein